MRVIKKKKTEHIGHAVMRSLRHTYIGRKVGETDLNWDYDDVFVTSMGKRLRVTTDSHDTITDIDAADIDEAASLPQADGYLVQIHFKNRFKDFRLSDCVFCRTIDEIADMASEKQPDIKVALEPKDGETIDALVKKIKKNGYDAIVGTNLFGDKVAYIPVARTIKVWPLVHGELVGVGTSMYMGDDNTLMNAKDVADIEKEIRQNLA